MDKPKAIHFPLSAEAEQQAEERAQRAHLHLRMPVIPIAATTAGEAWRHAEAPG